MQKVDSPVPHTLARSLDPATSKHAAGKVARFAGAHYRLILNAMIELLEVVDRRPIGASDIARRIGFIDAYQVRKRLPELKKAGLVALWPGTQLTESGRRERLWVLV